MIEFTAGPFPGVWVARPDVHTDDRGSFAEWFRPDLLLAATGQRFPVAQANRSVSRRGVVRGVHFAAVPPGQAKWVRCESGEVLDVTVDLRVGSPTFGAAATVTLTGDEPVSVVIAEGLGHAFCAVSEVAVLTYLVTTGYQPDREHAVHPLDPALGVDWPFPAEALILSARDRAAPTLEAAAAAGILPTWPTLSGPGADAAPQTDR